MSGDLVNHIVFVVDRSGSMRALEREVVTVFDGQIAHLARRSRELDQETRATVYLFDDTVDCLFYDKDVLRLPSLADHYRDRGRQTALLDASIKALDDLALTPELYGDHAFLVYVLTDGQENHSARGAAAALKRKLAALPDHWTVAVMVPDQAGVFEAKRFGFPPANVAVWSTTAAGLTEAGETMRRATESFMTARASGTRGTTNLFLVDATKLTAAVVNTNLRRLDPAQYELLAVTDRDDPEIAGFVEDRTRRPYVKGSAYYQLTKPEEIQPQKDVVVVHRRTGTAHAGPDARQLIGLPDGFTVKVAPASSPDYDVFVQSTSVNRKLVAGTRLLVRR
jgi:hypothetical protein